MCDSPAKDPKVAIAKLLQPDIVIMVFTPTWDIRKQPAQASSHPLPLLNFWQALRSHPTHLSLRMCFPVLKMQPGPGDRNLGVFTVASGAAMWSGLSQVLGERLQAAIVLSQSSKSVFAYYGSLASFLGPELLLSILLKFCTLWRGHFA